MRAAHPSAVSFIALVFITGVHAGRLGPLQDEPFVGWGGETFEADDTFIQSGDGKGWVQTLSWEPRVFLWRGFLSPYEAEHIIALARPHMKKSEVVDNETGKFVLDEARTSSGFFLQREQDETIAAIENRIASWTQLPMENGEPLHVLLYQESEEYRPHYDYFHDSVNVGNGGQRVATVLMYLTDVEEGGETVFPDSAIKPPAEEQSGFSECGRKGLAVRPRRGDALLFYDLHADGSLDPHSLHSGCPVVRGHKWSATKWIRVETHAV